MCTELPEKEERKNALVVNNARMAKELKDIEDTILHMLSSSQVPLFTKIVFGKTINTLKLH